MRLLSILLFGSTVFAQDNVEPLHLPKINLIGVCESKVMSVFMETGKIKKMLPRSLELVSDPAFPPGMHLVTIMFQVTSDLHLTGFPSFPEYHEVLFGINNVRQKGRTTVYSYFKKLYLDSWGPTVLGYYLGFPKHPGVFDFTADTYKATDSMGRPLASMTFVRKTNFNVESFQQNLEFVKSVLRRPVIADGYGPLVCSQFQFNFDSAEIYPIESTWKIESALVGVAGQFQVPSLDLSPAGGVSIKASWNLKGPIPCQ